MSASHSSSLSLARPSDLERLQLSDTLNATRRLCCSRLLPRLHRRILFSVHHHGKQLLRSPNACIAILKSLHTTARVLLGFTFEFPSLYKLIRVLIIRVGEDLLYR